MTGSQERRRIVVVLDEPQDVVNIGGVVRAMSNMGLHRMRLVRPAEFDAYRIQGVAHTGGDILRSVEFHETLADAVADCRLVVGTTARGRRVRREYRRPREVAREIVQMAAAGDDVALVFGREDRGLTNEDLDLCGRVAVIPTDPANPSLNLSQAVLVLAYEVFLASGEAPPFKVPRREPVPARSGELEALFRDVEAALWSVDFFKSRRVDAILRTLREVAGRADLDSREAALLRAMAIEVRKFLDRKGVDYEPGPED